MAITSSAPNIFQSRIAKITRLTSRNEPRLARLMDSNIIGVHISDINGNIKESNDAFLNIIGYSRKDMESGRILWTKMTPDEWKEADERAIHELQRHGAASPWEKEYIRKDGSRIPVLIGVALLPAGECICYVLDLTQRRRAEKRLEGQYAITRVLAESISLADAAPKLIQAVCECLNWDVGAIWTIDPPKQQMTFVDSWQRPSIHVDRFIRECRNQTFQKGVGLPGRVWSTAKPAWIGDVVNDRNFPRAPFAAGAGLHAAFGFPIIFAGKCLGVIEFFSKTIQKPDPELLQMLASTGSQIGQFVHRQQTESAAREIETRLKRQEMQREFIANVSHEFRTPVAAIKGFTETLRQGVEDRRHELEFLQIIDRHADRLSLLVEDLLELSALNYGEKQLEPEPINLRAFIGQFVTELAPLMRNKRISVKSCIPKDLRLYMDRRMLHRVLQSLLENAIDYNKDGGKIWTDAREAEGFTIISVRDSGVGIPRKELRRVFERFHRGAKARRMKPEGTGLGLSMARDIIEAHGGRIWAENPPDAGSKLTFSLPTAGLAAKPPLTSA